MKNDYEIRGEVTAIKLFSPKYGEMETLISTSKLSRADEFPHLWGARISNSTGTFYVQGKMLDENKKRKMVSFHRWIANDPVGKVIDHINHDTLDNTDQNLREATVSENSQNRTCASKNSKSGKLGIYWHKKSKKWVARITINKKLTHLGNYKNIQEAEQVVKEARAKYFPYSQEALSS